jgi:DHA1 family bicyclomycin/chloramphenicol resistance-like MFS transporter
MKTTLPLLTGLTALGSISVSIYLPSLPSLSLALHAPAASVKLSLTVFLFAFALSQLLYGPLSDRFGRKPPILGGLAIYIVGSVACIFAPNVLALITGRLVQGIGAAAGPALGRAVLRDLYSGDNLTSSLAVVAAAVALSPMLGPVIGGYLQVLFGWQSCFAFLLLAGLVLAFLTQRLLPETHHETSPAKLDPAGILGRYALLLRDQEYVAALLCGGLLTAGNFAWTAGAPFVLGKVHHVSPSQYGNLSLLIGAGYLLGTFCSGYFSRRILAPFVVYTGLALSLSAGVALYLVAVRTEALPLVIASMAVFTIGMGIVIPMSAACALSRHPEIAGSAAGLLGALQILVGTLGTLTIGFFGSSSTAPIAVILTVTSSLALIAAYVALLPFRSKTVSSQERLA